MAQPLPLEIRGGRARQPLAVLLPSERGRATLTVALVRPTSARSATCGPGAGGPAGWCSSSGSRSRPLALLLPPGACPLSAPLSGRSGRSPALSSPRGARVVVLDDLPQHAGTALRRLVEEDVAAVDPLGQRFRRQLRVFELELDSIACFRAAWRDAMTRWSVAWAHSR